MAKPEKKYRCGGVEGAIWKNNVVIDGHDVTKYSVQIQRRYQDSQGEWKDTSSFPLSDLPRVALVAARCFEWLTLKESDEQGQMQGNIDEPAGKPDSNVTSSNSIGNDNTDGGNGNSTGDGSSSVPEERVQ